MGLMRWAVVVIAVAAGLVAFMPTMAQQVGDASFTGQANVGEATLAALGVAWADCLAAAEGKLVAVRGIPIVIAFYKCDGVSPGFCDKRKRRGRVIYACGAEFVLVAVLPVSVDETYRICVNTLYVNRRITGRWKRTTPFNRWSCRSTASLPASAQVQVPAPVS